MVGTPVRKVRYEPSITHIRHLLAITELATCLTEHARSHSLELDIETEPSCWRTVAHRRQPLKLDLYVCVANTAVELRWFIEIDRGTESATVIARKLNDYATYWHTGTEQDRHGVFPKTLWIAPHQGRANFLADAVNRATQGRVEAALFAVATNDNALDQLTDLANPDESKEKDQ